MAELALAASLCLGVAATVVGLWLLGRSPPPQTILPVDDAPRRRHHPTFVPAVCGLPTQSPAASCVRRRNHSGRCLSEEDYEELAERPTPVLDVDVAALARHVASPPDWLLQNAPAHVALWVARAQAAARAVATGASGMSEWGDTHADDRIG